VSDESAGRWRSAAVADWEARGRYLELGGHRIFTLDVPAAEPSEAPPVVLLHGFPTSSFDFHRVIDGLARRRRVLALDLLGYGLSDKPDQPYRLDQQADLVMDYLGLLDVEAFVILAHDMGDSVAGELLARQLDQVWPVDVQGAVLTNGSIYIELAQLAVGQRTLLDLPDARLDPGLVDEAALGAALAATFGPANAVSPAELAALCELVAHNGGDRVLPRLIRYMEERRTRQGRFTGAIERHPAPLTIVWGTEDPIAVPAIATRLCDARPDARLVLLPGVGHYPMIEAPERFADSVATALL
jgi:pimeloyl-ACP methyl ester carboxylesterase